MFLRSHVRISKHPSIVYGGCSVAECRDGRQDFVEVQCKMTYTI